MSHSALCWWCLLRSVRATHRVAVHLTILGPDDIGVRGSDDLGI